LKNPKNVGAKVENFKNFPVKILKIQKSSGRKFVRPDFSGRKTKMPENYWGCRLSSKCTAELQN